MLNDCENPHLHHGANRVRGWIFCFAVFACPLVYSFQFTSFLHPKELLLALCLVGMGFCALATLGKHDIATSQGTIVWLLILSCGIPLLGVLCMIYPSAFVFQYAMESYVKLFLLATILALWTHDLIADPCWYKRIWNAAILSGMGVALLALGQYYGLLEFMFPVFPGYDQPMYSVFGNQDLLGAYIAIIMPMLLHRMLDKDHRPARFVLLLFALALLAWVLALSASRSAWLAAAVGLALILWWHRDRVQWKKQFLPLAGIALAVALMNAPLLIKRVTNTFSAEDVGGRARLWFWDGALRMIADYPITGVGLGNYKYWSPYYQGLALHAPGGEQHFHNTLHTVHAHNEYLEFIAESGLIGAALLLIFVVFLVRCRGVSWIPLITLAICAGFTAALHSAPHAVLGYIFCAHLMVNPEKIVLRKSMYAWTTSVLYNFIIILLLLIICVTYFASYSQAKAEHAHITADEKTLEIYEGLARFNIFNSPYFESWGIACLEENEPEDAYILFEMAKQGLDTGRIHYLLGIAAEGSGEKEKAFGHFQDALFRWPGDQQTFDALWALAPNPAWQENFRAHAKRFGLQIPRSYPKTLKTSL